MMQLLLGSDWITHPSFLALFSINSMGMRYGMSKLCQILIPLLGYILIRDLLIQGVLLRQPAVQSLLQRLQGTQFFQRWQGDLPQLFDQALGLMAWKIGCDLGFFLIVDALGPWERAFTWSGLLPYTLIQYFLYYWVGRRMLIEGALNPFQPRPTTPPPAQRPTLTKRLLSKYLHEDVNVTSEHIPLRQVFLKPVVDYGGLVASWSFYTVGIFYSQSGEMTLAPVVHFGFFQMLTFYLVNTYGYILGYNLGELLYLRLSELDERLSQWGRRQAQILPRSGQDLPSQLFWQVKDRVDRLREQFQTLKYTQLQPVFAFLDRYGLNLRWLLSASGGVFCVILVAPSWSHTMLDLGKSADRVLFQVAGRINSHQVEQVEQAIHPRALPPSADLLTGFPEAWAALYQDPLAVDSPTAEEVALKTPKLDDR
ncbi:MAG: hypothetical protein ACO4AI_01405 [Prochlorothrix sp.]